MAPLKTYRVNTGANNNLPMPPASFAVLEGPYSDSRDTLSHVQLTSNGPHTAFISESPKLMLPQVQCGFCFKSR